MKVKQGSTVASMQAQSVTVAMEYIGSDLSVNHYTGRARGHTYVKKDVRKWQADLGWMLKTYHLEIWRRPLHIHLEGTFRDKRSCPDLHNITKVVCDAIEELIFINDREFLTSTGEPKIDPTKDPEIFITVTEAEL